MTKALRSRVGGTVFNALLSLVNYDEACDTFATKDYGDNLLLAPNLLFASPRLIRPSHCP